MLISLARVGELSAMFVALNLATELLFSVNCLMQESMFRMSALNST